MANRRPGADGTRNAVHGSDSAASANREIAFHFPVGWEQMDTEARQRV
jgi:hypothetical protein